MGLQLGKVSYNAVLQLLQDQVGVAFKLSADKYTLSAAALDQSGAV